MSGNNTVVGSNIYEVKFLDDELYLYQANKTPNTISYKDGIVISSKKLDAPEVPL